MKQSTNNHTSCLPHSLKHPDTLKVDALSLIPLKITSIVSCTCVAMCMALPFRAIAGGKNSIFATQDSIRFVADSDVANDGLQKTLELNFSPETREKLRKALDDYAKSVDRDHEQIEERRRVMQKSIETRFLEADSDGDGTIDRQEATERLPQIARHFNQVDENQDNVISLEELEDAQVRILERRKIAETALDAKKLQEAEASVVSKRKGKQTAETSRKHTL